MKPQIWWALLNEVDLGFIMIPQPFDLFWKDQSYGAKGMKAL